MTSALWDDSLSRAWLVGLYEGEGCCGAASDAKRPYLRYLHLQIVMADEDIIRRAHAVAGVGNVTFVKRQNERHSDMWRWGVTRSASAYAVLVALFPLLGERRRIQVTRAIKGWLTSRPLPRLTPVERMCTYIDKSEGHWVWNGQRQRGDYPIFGVRQHPTVRVAPQRWIYEIRHGVSLRGKRLTNTCGLRHCVKPEHWQVEGGMYLEAEDSA
jgi:hypothetical protein